MLTIKGTQELQAAALLFRNCEQPIKRALQKEAKAWAPEIVAAAKARARGPVQQAIAASGRTTVTNKGPSATFGSAGKVSGAHLAELTRPYEFGTPRQDAYTTYLSRHRVSRRAMKVTRRTLRQIPRLNRDGHFIYPALAEATPKLVTRYVRAIAQVMTDGR